MQLTIVNQWVDLFVGGESRESLLQLLQAGGREIRIAKHVICDGKNLGELRKSLEYVQVSASCPTRR